MEQPTFKPSDPHRPSESPSCMLNLTGERTFLLTRQIVAERLALASDQLPEDVKPHLAPISSIMGQILMIGMFVQPLRFIRSDCHLTDGAADAGGLGSQATTASHSGSLTSLHNGRRPKAISSAGAYPMSC